jgi:hypothetical protein
MVESVFECRDLVHDREFQFVSRSVVEQNESAPVSPTTSEPPNGQSDQELAFPLTLTPLEKFLFHCETPESPMVIRMLVRLSGTAQVDLLRDTLSRSISRHPLLTCRIARQNGQLVWIQGTADQIDVCRVAGSIFEPECGPISTTIDLQKSAGLQARLMVMDDGIKCIIDAHHAVTDGNGLRQAIINDWLHLYHSEVYGTPNRLSKLNPTQLQDRHKFPAPANVNPVSLRDAITNFLTTVRGRTCRWPLAKRPTASKSTSFIVEHILTGEQYEQLHERLSAWKVNLNDLVIACCMSVFSRLSPQGCPNHRITVLNPVDLRRSSDRVLPAANRFGLAFLRRIRSDCHDPAKLLRGIHGEMKYVLSNNVGVEFIKGLSTATRIPFGLDFFHWLGWFVPSLQWTCLCDMTRSVRRLISVKDGVLSAGGLVLETITGFAPCAKNVPLSVATCEAGRTLTLTVCSSSRFLNLEETQTFATTLVSELCNFTFPAEEAAATDTQSL